MELLKLTLNEIISYQVLLILLEGTNHKQSSQNNQSTWCFSKVRGAFFSTLKIIHLGTNIFWAKDLCGCYSKWEG